MNAIHPKLSSRIHAVGEVLSAAVSTHLRACDMLLQPYPDGVSSRRTSVMSGLANGVPVVTNMGWLSEPIWDNGAVAAAAGPDPLSLAKQAARILDDPPARAGLGERGAALYRETFALHHTISRLREGTK
jgi:glycosyltransferase involved in cell wall biosynthesis